MQEDLQGDFVHICEYGQIWPVIKKKVQFLNNIPVNTIDNKKNNNSNAFKSH